MEFDLIIQGGTVVDGSGAPRFTADIGIANGRIGKIGNLSRAAAAKRIDAAGLIVAPGSIDIHSHYDAQLAWDPYCRSSGWHGVTSSVVGICGFGFAPCKRTDEAHERYMRMMENTEQVPYAVMKKALPWSWETFPEWLDYLRSLPKGINIATYLPMNPLLSYVVGADEAKRRPATAAERKQMRDILHEAMDAGASGFSFSHLGAEGNSHVDYDFTAMPADVMAFEEAYNLADVLRERGEGSVQALIEIQGMDLSKSVKEREFLEELARRAERPIIHNMTSVDPAGPVFHRSVMRWLDDCAAKGLQVYSQAFSIRTWIQMRVAEYNAWDSVPIFREYSSAGLDGKLRLAKDPDFRRRMKEVYNEEEMGWAAGSLEDMRLIAVPGAPQLERNVGKTVRAIAAESGQTVIDTFFDIVAATNLEAEFRPKSNDPNPDYYEEIFRHPRMVIGASDGGAHTKFFCGGYFPTDFLTWLVRDEKRFTIEEAHHMLAAKPARLFGLSDRGLLQEGKAADIVIYDFEKLSFDHEKYGRLVDLPGGDWARAVIPRGIRFTIVNGEITHEDSVTTGAHPGKVLRGVGGSLPAARPFTEMAAE
ncbi:MAG: amidohydrolase family protein [Rhizomicrobium sp.]